MKKISIVLFLSFSILFVGCQVDSGKKSNSSSDLSDYFFPTDSLKPYIYVFQEESNPMDEKMFRMYRLENDNDTSLVIERFNANFRITEGFTHDLNDSLNITDYMIVDKDGIKRKANVLANQSFPLSKDHVAYFAADFPSHIDSIPMIYESKRHVIKQDFEVKLFGKNVEAIKVADSIKIHIVNPKTKRSKTEKAVTTRVYAKGYGLVEWSSEELNVSYKLTRILTDEWWSEFAQGPQVKF
ncbi:MAG: hypothetical protein WED10_06875 [Brumimicrobium sp.]